MVFWLTHRAGPKPEVCLLGLIEAERCWAQWVPRATCCGPRFLRTATPWLSSVVIHKQDTSTSGCTIWHAALLLGLLSIQRQTSIPSGHPIAATSHLLQPAMGLATCTKRPPVARLRTRS